jgi:hypothetical protein
MILRIDSKEGQVKIGNPPELLPGILSSITINGDLSIDNASIEGRSGSSKQVHGWNDAAVSISLILIGDTKTSRFDSLAVIVSHFKKDEDGTPVVYTFHHPMAKAWNIRQLLFSSLNTTEDNKLNQIIATLEFVEHDPITGLSQERKDVLPDSTTEEQDYSSIEKTINPAVQKDIEIMESKYEYI